MQNLNKLTNPIGGGDVEKDDYLSHGIRIRIEIGLEKSDYAKPLELFEEWKWRQRMGIYRRFC